MKILNNMPEEGNFVAVWEYNGLIWSNSFLFIDKVLHMYREYNDEGEMFDDWDEIKPEDHPGLAYDPLGTVPDRYFVVKD